MKMSLCFKISIHPKFSTSVWLTVKPQESFIVIILNGCAPWLGSAGQFSFGISHVVTIRRQPGLESGRGKTQIAVFISISLWSSLMVFTQGALSFQACVLRKSTGGRCISFSSSPGWYTVSLLPHPTHSRWVIKASRIQGEGIFLPPLDRRSFKESRIVFKPSHKSILGCWPSFWHTLLLVLLLSSFCGSLKIEPDRSLFFHSCLPPLLYYYSGRTEAR